MHHRTLTGVIASTAFFISSVTALPAPYSLPYIPATGADSVLALKAKNMDRNDTVEGRYIVGYVGAINNTELQEHQDFVQRLLKKRNFLGGVTRSYSMDGFKGYNIEADDDTLAEISARSEVAWIEQDAYSYASALVSQPSATYGLARLSHKVKGQSGYTYDSSAGAGIKVYIIDTGIMTSHAEFQGRASWGVNFIEGSPDADENGHGTHCAGTVGGSTYGVAKSASMIAVKVLDANGAGTNSDIIAGVQWVVNNAQAGSVISMSLGGSKSAALNAAANAAYNNGITVVVAAGNEGVLASGDSPASAAGAITVGAVDATDTRPSFSNYGNNVNIFAPGVAIESAWIGTGGNETNTISGTSMATPHVAGLAAYLIAKEKLASPADVLSRITVLATAGTVSAAGSGSPNLIAYNGDGA